MPSSDIREPAIAVLGGGSWGTALAWLLAQGGRRVALWCRSEEQARAIRHTRRNPHYFPALDLGPVAAVSDLSRALSGARLAVLALPSGALAPVCADLSAAAAGLPILLASKGLEEETGRRLSQLVASALEAPADRVAVLSGPNLAGEIVECKPSATVIAADDPAFARELQGLFSRPHFRVYTNPDVAGVELGGALKNPVAIAAGICDGLELGNNSKAGLLTRGLAEMIRLGVASGARAETFSGLSGLGDLLTTAYSPLSRNHRVGLALGRGLSPRAAVDEIGQTAEGVPTAAAARVLASRLAVETPLLETLCRVLFEGLPARSAVEQLLARPAREETWGL